MFNLLFVFISIFIIPKTKKIILTNQQIMPLSWVGSFFFFSSSNHHWYWLILSLTCMILHCHRFSHPLVSRFHVFFDHLMNKYFLFLYLIYRNKTWGNKLNASNIKEVNYFSILYWLPRGSYSDIINFFFFVGDIMYSPIIIIWLLSIYILKYLRQKSSFEWHTRNYFLVWRTGILLILL